MKQAALRQRSVAFRGKVLATLVPCSERFQYSALTPGQNDRYVLSRFAYCRRVGSTLVLESPLGYARLLIHEKIVAACLNSLASPRSSLELSKDHRIAVKTVRRIMDLLLNCKALSRVDEQHLSLEDRARELIPWEFHDLLFHARSRTGRHGNVYGRTDRFNKVLSKAPPVKIDTSSSGIELFRPDITALRKKDASFTSVMEGRKSLRTPGKRSITGKQLGEFLFRSARIRKILFAKGGDKLTDRVYPCSGAAYELEIYVAIDRCRDIPSGLYHYDPFHHRLFRLLGKTSPVRQLLKSAAATAHTSTPQILFIVSARFQRISLRYASIAYAAILKDVGVLYQTFYLVATAMKLAPCALGVGNSDLFADAAGLDYFSETSVGEFILNRG